MDNNATKRQFYIGGIEDPWAGSQQDRDRVLSILRGFEGYDPLEALIPALHELQKEYGYIPEEAANIISQEWQIPATDLFGVVTFYADFRTEPRGRNMLWICEGAACYFMGGPQLGQAAQEKLKIEYGETTLDGEWTLRRADFCYGACHLAPLVDLNHTVFGPLSKDELGRLIDNPPKEPEGSHKL